MLSGALLEEAKIKQRCSFSKQDLITCRAMEKVQEGETMTNICHYVPSEWERLSVMKNYYRNRIRGLNSVTQAWFHGESSI